MTGLHEQPWWASGGDPEDGIDAADPLHAHREARRGEQGRDPREGHRRGTAGPGPSGQHSRHDEARASHRHGSGDPACQACPICMALRALESSRPELIGHLSEALHHLSLAAKAFVDAQAAQHEPTGDLERIDLEDEDVAEDGMPDGD